MDELNEGYRDYSISEMLSDLSWVTQLSCMAQVPSDSKAHDFNRHPIFAPLRGSNLLHSARQAKLIIFLVGTWPWSASLLYLNNTSITTHSSQGTCTFSVSFLDKITYAFHR